MASYDITGILKVKNETQAVSNTFSKREFVITTDTHSQYPQYISMQLTQDKCSQLDAFNIGDELKVSFNLRGREWNSPDGIIKYFNSLEAWRIEKFTGTPQTPVQTGAATQNITPQSQSAAAEVISTETSDDLPF